MGPTVKPHIPQALEELVQALDSNFFKTLTDPTRIQIIKVLMLASRADISTIAHHFPQDRTVISRHLQLMREAGLLVVEKVTRHRFYSLNGAMVLSEFETIVAHLKACMHACCPPQP